MRKKICMLVDNDVINDSRVLKEVMVYRENWMSV